ncbi:MAG: DUF2062 domain-containing protein [Spirochaetota bacterium]
MSDEGRKKGRNGIARGFRVLVILLKRTRTPHRLALGFAIGLFFSILPLPIIGMFIALGLALLFRLNLVSTYAGTLVVNFATGLFFYLLDYKAGTILFGTKFIKPMPSADIARFVADNIREIAVGGIFVASVFGIISYLLVYGIARLFMRRGKPRA